MLSIALIGCGEMGRTHAAVLSRFPNVRLHTFCDIDRQKAESLCETFSGHRVCTDAGEIFADPHIDVVYVLSRTDSHLNDCLGALKAGKHLFVEKPLALTLKDSQQIAQVADQSDRLVMAGFKFRFYEMVQKARSIIPCPFMISVQVMDDPWPADFWANDPQKGGGHIISQGVHGADLLRHCAGAEPMHVYAVGRNYHQPSGVIDHFSATFQFENGTAGSLVVGDCAQAPLVSKFMIQLHGVPGSVLVAERLTRLYFKPQQSTHVTEFSAEENGFLEENIAFVKALNDEAALTSTLWDGYVAQAMIEAAIRSTQSGQVEMVLSKKV